MAYAQTQRVPIARVDLNLLVSPLWAEFLVAGGIINFHSADNVTEVIRVPILLKREYVNGFQYFSTYVTFFSVIRALFKTNGLCSILQ